MEKISMLKKSLVFATVIIALGASTAFAAHHNNMQNNPTMHMNKTSYMSSDKQMLMHHNRYKTSPTMTLSKLSNMPVKAIIKECKMEYLDSYQFAEKHGFLNKYKVERMMIAKENVQMAVDKEKLDILDSKKVLDKINDNIAQEKPEMTAVYCNMKPTKIAHHKGMQNMDNMNDMHGTKDMDGMHNMKNMDGTKDMDSMQNMKNMKNKDEGRYFDFKYHDNFGANVMNMDE